jgi:hypothetical protein
MRRALLLTALLTAPALVFGATPLTYLIDDRPTAVQWPGDAFPLRYVVDGSLIAAEPAAGAAVARSFSAWEVPQSGVRFQGSTAAAPGGRNGMNSVSVVSGLFEGSGFIAATTTWFNQSGLIEEADIKIDAAALREYPLEALVQHEVGHLLGLDHSAVVSAAMFPFLSKDRLPRLGSDDQLAIKAMYPSAEARRENSAIGGSVRSDGAPLFGAQVVAMNSQGVPVASTLSAADGSFNFPALPDGNYTFYAEPLDGPVEARNLSGVWRGLTARSFRTTFMPESNLAGKAATPLVIDVGSAPAAVNARWIGAFETLSGGMQLGSMVTEVEAGRRVVIAVGGDGLTPGATFEIAGGGFTRVGDFQYGSGTIAATFDVSPDTPAEPVVVIIRSNGETVALTGGVTVEPPSRRRSVRR